MAGTATPATALLGKQKVEHRVHTYTHRGGQAYGPEAAEALGLDAARVFKTLVAEVDGTDMFTVRDLLLEGGEVDASASAMG